MKRLNKLSIVFVILTLVAFSGCSLCEKTVYVDRPVEVLVEVPCKVKDTVCKVSGTDGQVVIGLVECIADMKAEQRVCQ